MIQVILVDDEPLIRNGLVKLINWESFGMQVEAVFPNGLAALEYLEKDKADLIITDIKMPVMNGIALMQECLKRKYPVKFIVLSGYSDFEYVRTAATIGIENYLLKPVDIRELSQTLSQVKRKIEAQRQDKILQDEGMRILRNNLLYRLMTGEISYEELQERRDYLPVSLDSEGYRVAIIKFLPKDPQEAFLNPQKPPIAAVQRRLEEKKQIHAVTDFSGRLLYLLCGGFPGEGVSHKKDSPRGSSHEKKELQSDLEQILNFISATSPFYACAAVGLPVLNIDAICESYRKAFTLINTAGSDSPCSIRWAGETAENEALLLPHIEFDQLMLLNEKLAYKDKNEILHIIDDIFYTNRYIPLSGLQILAFMIVTKICSNVRAYSTVTGQEMRRLENRLEEAYSLPDCDSLHAWVKSLIDQLFSLEQKKGQGGVSNIKKIILYLEENYCCDINLKTLADTFQMNALYLGRILKLETGLSFTDYLNRLRLDKAADYLIHTELSAKQISEKVGYSNDKYFNTLFKKHTNMTPMEYRKRNAQSKEDL